MKKLFTFLFSTLIVSLYMGNVVFADSGKVLVTEDVPGAGCKCVVQDQTTGTYKEPTTVEERKKCGSVTTRKFECTTSSGLTGFQQIFAAIVKYFVYIAMLLGVLAIVALGIGYAVFSGGDEEKTKLVKKYAINLIVGLIILFFFRYILGFLAPWIYQ